MKLKMTYLAALAAISFVGSASAVSIYTDTLTGADTALNGTAADSSSAFAGGTVGATWTSGTVNETATGAVYSSTGGGGADAAFLPITISSGFVYTLSATLATSSVAGWTALGFSDVSTNGGWNGTGNKSAWALVQATGVGVGPQFFGGPDTANGAGFAPGVNGTQLVTITLDTSAPAWTTFATIGTGIGAVNSGTFTYTINPTINFAGFGQVSTDITSTVTNFSLSAVEAVPEPSAAILGAFGALALLRRRRA